MNPGKPGVSAVGAPSTQSGQARAKGDVPKTKQREPAKSQNAGGGFQMQPGYVYATIAAVVILGYFYIKSNPAPVPVQQNTELNQPDSSGQRIASMENYIRANPNDKEALLGYANMLHDAKEFPRAITAYKNYLGVDPKNPDARVDMAICYFESGNAPIALAELQKALEYSPKHQPAMFNLGIVYLNQEKVKESNDWFTRCAAVDPTTPLAARAKQLLSQHSSTNTNLQ
jgi:tetratricopeptide (TPR) repeat protein